MTKTGTFPASYSEIQYEGSLNPYRKISFYEFLLMLIGGKQEEPLKRADSTQLHKVFKNDLVGKFENIAASHNDTSNDRIADIRAQYAVRKTEADAKKIAAETEKTKREDEDRSKIEAKARLAARAAMFQAQ